MIRAGLIGLGEVAQLMHLPILKDLSDRYQVLAVADIAPSLAQAVSKKYDIGSCFTDAEKLIQNPDIDAVFVLSPDPYHARYAAAAIRAGKHVFIEKPVALCSSDVDELIELAEAHPKQVTMVGYMRRFAAPFLKAAELLHADSRPVQYIRFRDIILESPFFIGQTRPVIRPEPDEITLEQRAEYQALKKIQLAKAIGLNATLIQQQAYGMLTGLGCHSFSAVRELIGLPKRVHSVLTNAKGEHLIISLEYDGFIGVYELLNDQAVVQFDAAIEIYQGDRLLKIKYETPYIRYQPAALEVIESTATETKTTKYGPSMTDAFATELIEFHRCVMAGEKPKTTLQDANQDLHLFEEIIHVLGKGAAQ